MIGKLYFKKGVQVITLKKYGKDYCHLSYIFFKCYRNGYYSIYLKLPFLSMYTEIVGYIFVNV